MNRCQSTVLQEILHRHADILGDLAQQDCRKIAARVKRDGGAPPISMPELNMRAALTNFLEPQLMQNGNDLAGLEDGDAGHSGNFDGLNSDELRFKARGTILAQHLDDLLEIGIEFIQGGRLRMRTGKAWNISDVESGIGTTLNYSGIGFHKCDSPGFNACHFSSSGERV